MATLEGLVDTEVLLALNEIREPVIIPSIDGGEPSKGEIIHRWGPLLLGYREVSRIAVHRSSKPSYDTKPLITRRQFKELLFRHASAAPVEPIVGETERRLDRSLDLYLEGKRVDKKNCVFCPDNIYTKTPSPRITHQDLRTSSGNQVISVPNISPFMQEHLVTAFAGHIGKLSDLTYQDMDSYMLSVFQIARDYENRGAVGMHSFFNLGQEAGGSVIHLHTHNGLVNDTKIFYLENERASIFQGLNGTGYFMTTKLMDALKDKGLTIFENDHVFIYAAWAPRYPHQVEVFFRNPRDATRGGNVLEFDPEDLRVASRSLLGVYHALGDLGVTDLNTALHQSPFKDGPAGYRMQAEFTPRNLATHGGAETTKKFYVSPTLPEETAKFMRGHFNR